MSEDKKVEVPVLEPFPQVPIVNMPEPSFLMKYGVQCAWIWVAICVVATGITAVVFSETVDLEMSLFAAILIALIVINSVVVAAVATVGKLYCTRVEKLLWDRVRDRNQVIEDFRSMCMTKHELYVEAWTQVQENQELIGSLNNQVGDLGQGLNDMFDLLVWIVNADHAEFMEWFCECDTEWDLAPSVVSRDGPEYTDTLHAIKAQYFDERDSWREIKYAQEVKLNLERSLSHKALLALIEFVMIVAVEATKIEDTPDEMKSQMDQLSLAVFNIFAKLVSTHRELHANEVTRADGDEWVVNNIDCGLLCALGARQSKPHEIQKLLNLLREHQPKKFLEVLNGMPDDIKLVLTSLMIHAPDKW